MKQGWNRAATGTVLAFAAVAFVGGIGWGLPSRDSDRYLFGGEFPWSGVEIQQLIPRDEGGIAGADVAASKLDRSKANVLNATDADRARIVRRYRLFTTQPDEWVTIAALSKMHPGSGDFDPKLYQYGGVWVYGVGAIFEAANVFGLATVSPDVTQYLDRPDQIGRLYELARLYSVAWGLLGVWLAYVLVKRGTGSWWAAVVGAMCFATLPGVVDLAHEAKPHLACLVATMAAAACAAKYLETGRRRWWIWAGVCCGLAFGLVLTGAIALAILPMMGILQMRRSKTGGAWSWIGPAVGALLIACAIFAASNPYLVMHLIKPAASGGAVGSNLGNTAAMYRITSPLAGYWNVIGLIGEGSSLPVAVAGVAGAILLAIKSRQGGCNDGVWLLAGPAALTALASGPVGAGKPGEFGRFLLDVDVLLLLLAITAAVKWTKNGTARTMILALLLLATILSGGRYWLGFVQDTGGNTTRAQAAQTLAKLEKAGNRQVALWAEPAPYSTPPMDLIHQQLVLAPDGTAVGRLPADDVGVSAMDRVEGIKDQSGFLHATITGSGQSGGQTPISWAAKPFVIWLPERLKEGLLRQ